MRIADMLEAAFDAENEHSLADEVWHIHKALKSLRVELQRLGILHLR